MDTYGDFEQLVQERRKANEEREYYIPLASASTVYEAPQWVLYEWGLPASDARIDLMKQ